MEQYQAVQDEIKRREKQYARCKHRTTYPLTGLIRCENCGKNYRRKTTPQGIAWVCSTYNTQGKAACDAGYIPEDILLAALGELDKIDFVTASKNNALEITFKNGTKCVKQPERK
ncbi:MAG: zinc ribbon domain-containing protein [Oscillospiraceae bacterium]|nr:zinc ribbon domain-containing protein [Oscillospiraceae bacterium]